MYIKQGGFSNHVVSPAFAITYFCNHCNIRFENTSKYVDTLTLFSKHLNQRSLTPRWPLTPCLLRSHEWLYPRIIVSKSHDNTSMYVDTVINFAKYHTHTHTTYIYIHTTLHTTYRMSDHIVSYWTQFRRDKNHVSGKGKQKRQKKNKTTKWFFSTWTCWIHQCSGKSDIWARFWLICEINIKKDRPNLWHCYFVYFFLFCWYKKLLIAVFLLKYKKI